jgi:hypothetical protein
MNEIDYVVGDVRNQPFTGTRIIPHCCNDIQKMGSGVAKAIYQKWPEVKIDYINQSNLKLGQSYMVKVEDNTYVANMIGQHKIQTCKKNGISVGSDGLPPIRYIALAMAMKRVAKFIKDNNIENPVIHAPLFGCDLAGGDFKFIELLIREAWLNVCPVKVCVLNKKMLPV